MTESEQKFVYVYTRYLITSSYFTNVYPPDAQHSWSVVSCQEADSFLGVLWKRLETSTG